MSAPELLSEAEVELPKVHKMPLCFFCTCYRLGTIKYPTLRSSVKGGSCKKTLTYWMFFHLNHFVKGKYTYWYYYQGT